MKDAKDFSKEFIWMILGAALIAIAIKAVPSLPISQIGFAVAGGILLFVHVANAFICTRSNQIHRVRGSLLASLAALAICGMSLFRINSSETIMVFLGLLAVAGVFFYLGAVQMRKG